MENTKLTLSGRGLRVELDRSECYEGGTPAMVYASHKGIADFFCASWGCALDQGELSSNGDAVRTLGEAQMAWLESQEETVEEFLYGTNKSAAEAEGR